MWRFAMASAPVWSTAGAARRLPEVAEPALRLLPVRITDEPVLPAAAGGCSPDRASGLMEIVFADGVRLRVDETVSSAALRRVVAVLRR